MRRLFGAHYGEKPKRVRRKEQIRLQAIESRRAEQLVTTLLGEEAIAATPFERPKVTLEYRPYLNGETWKWFWVILPDHRHRALAHGESDNRTQASIDARLRARKLGVAITHVEVVQPHKEGGTQLQGAATPRPA